MTATYFPSAEEFREIIAPVVADAVEQLGSVVTLFPVAETEQLDGSTVVAVSGSPVEDVMMKLRSVTTEQARETFGVDTVVTMTGKMTRDNDIALRTVVEVTGADFAGQVLQVVAIIERPLSDSYLLGLVSFTGDLS